MTDLPISLPADRIEAFCKKWKIVRLDLFGSVLRDDFGPESDVDFLYDFAPDARWGLLDVIGMEEELQAIVGRKVDFVDREAIAQSKNWLLRKEIFSSVRPVYVAA